MSMAAKMTGETGLYIHRKYFSESSGAGGI